MLDRLPHRLRESARGTARASQMLADDKSSRNRAAGDVGACYMGVKAEDTAEWQAADEIERLHSELLAARRLSHEWMVKHDQLLAFIQARPAMLKELIADTSCG